MRVLSANQAFVMRQALRCGNLWFCNVVNLGADGTCCVFRCVISLGPGGLLNYCFR